MVKTGFMTLFPHVFAGVQVGGIERRCLTTHLMVDKWET